MQLDKAGGHDDEASSREEERRPTRLLANSNEERVQFACLDDEGAVILGRKITEDGFGVHDSSFGIRKFGLDGNLIEELYTSAFVEDGELTSLVFDPRRVCTYSYSPAATAMQSMPLTVLLA